MLEFFWEMIFFQNKNVPLHLASAEVLNLLILDGVDEHWLGDVALKGGVEIGLPDLRMQQSLHAALELRRDRLRLVRDLRDFFFLSSPRL